MDGHPLTNYPPARNKIQLSPTFQRVLPAGLEGLFELALDLRFTGSQMSDLIWERLDPAAWERTRNPYVILENISESRLEEASRDEVLRTQISRWIEERRRALSEPGWFQREHSGKIPGAIAYFSMEFGLCEALPIYSGGLGLLAGDHLKTASDLGVPMTGIGLLYQQGYFRQILSKEFAQIEAFPYNDPTTMPVVPARDGDGRWLRIELDLPGRKLFLRVWRACVGRVEGFRGAGH